MWFFQFRCIFCLLSHSLACQIDKNSNLFIMQVFLFLVLDFFLCTDFVAGIVVVVDTLSRFDRIWLCPNSLVLEYDKNSIIPWFQVFIKNNDNDIRVHQSRYDLKQFSFCFALAFDFFFSYEMGVFLYLCCCQWSETRFEVFWFNFEKKCILLDTNSTYRSIVCKCLENISIFLIKKKEW